MQNNLTTTIQQLDDNDQIMARRVITTTDDAPETGEYRSGLLTTTSQTTISLPIAQVRQLWFRNIHASAKITLVWTPTTGAEATTIITGPNDIVAFWHNNTGATYGISSLKLTSDTADADYELFLGG